MDAYMSRSREEIDAESNKAADVYPNDEYTQRKVIIELLLDIRDLLNGTYDDGRGE